MVANFDDFEKSCHFSNIKFFFLELFFLQSKFNVLLELFLGCF